MVDLDAFDAVHRERGVGETAGQLPGIAVAEVVDVENGTLYFRETRDILSL